MSSAYGYVDAPWTLTMNGHVVNKFKRTDIICTIGPASRSVEKLVDLINAGMGVARLNFSHGTHEYHQGTIDNVKTARSKVWPNPIAIALDTKGPEIRTGKFVNGGDLELKSGQALKVSVNPDDFLKGTSEMIYMDYRDLVNTVKVGDTIYVDDGLLELKITEKGADFVNTRVVNHAKLGEQKGCNLPNCKVSLPAVTEKDKGDLAFGVQNEVDMIFASFVRKPQDVADIRAVLGEKGKDILIISKIENQEGVDNFQAILEVSDGIMVARGDLGIEIPPQKVFLCQKMMISSCNRVGKPVICATQMLESMTYNPRPTRAEVSDVANAVLDGSDCVMLSGETAKGEYPLETVTMMSNICKEAESILPYHKMFLNMREAMRKPHMSPGETIASSAVNASFEQQAKAILVLTNTGTTAKDVARYRPYAPIFAITSNLRVARQLRLTHGIFSVIYEQPEGKKLSVDERLAIAIDWGKTNNFFTTGDYVIAVHADSSTSGHANLLRCLSI